MPSNNTYSPLLDCHVLRDKNQQYFLQIGTVTDSVGEKSVRISYSFWGGGGIKYLGWSWGLLHRTQVLLDVCFFNFKNNSSLFASCLTETKEHLSAHRSSPDWTARAKQTTCVHLNKRRAYSFIVMTMLDR